MARFRDILTAVFNEQRVSELLSEMGKAAKTFPKIRGGHLLPVDQIERCLQAIERSAVELNDIKGDHPEDTVKMLRSLQIEQGREFAVCTASDAVSEVAKLRGTKTQKLYGLAKLVDDLLTSLLQRPLPKNGDKPVV
jgi:hypothetical protein